MEANSTQRQEWSKIVSVVRSPLNFFALVVLVSATVFSIAAASMEDPLSFKYCIHMFLGIIGFLGAIALWSPKSLYHPAELRDIDPDKLPEHRPMVPTVTAVAMILVYMAYQLTKGYLGLPE